MIKSMTGFGKATVEKDNIKILVEVRTLNSKFLDPGIRLPRLFTDKEIEIKKMIGEKLERGKVSLNIDYYKEVDTPGIFINETLFKKYYQQLKSLAKEVDSATDELFKIALQSPEVMVAETKEESTDEDWALVKEVILEAIENCDQFRMMEGEVLKSNLIKDIDNIQKLLVLVDEQDPHRAVAIREKLKKHLEEAQNFDKIDANRLEQELIYYIEKLDINEEKVRLKSHLDYFIEVIEAGNSQGKKLGFIAQEIGREINTIGSKANNAIIQKHVVGMKEELEKIKEQLLNVI